MPSLSLLFSMVASFRVGKTRPGACAEARAESSSRRRGALGAGAAADAAAATAAAGAERGDRDAGGTGTGTPLFKCLYSLRDSTLVPEEPGRGWAWGFGAGGVLGSGEGCR